MSIIYKKLFDGTVHYLSCTNPVEWNGIIENAFDLPIQEAQRLSKNYEIVYPYDKIGVIENIDGQIK